MLRRLLAWAVTLTVNRKEKEETGAGWTANSLIPGLLLPGESASFGFKVMLIPTTVTTSTFRCKFNRMDF